MSLYAQMEKNAQFQAELQRYEEQADFLFRKQRLERIEYFQDSYEFLANEYPCAVYYEGLIFSSVYAAFQAARSDDEELRIQISNAQQVLEVFQMAQHIDDPKEWSKNRLKIMEVLLRDKFRRNLDLRESLRGTNEYQLINSYSNGSVSNMYWGVHNNKGQNWLGRLLEQIRTDIQNNDDLEKWLLMTFQVERDSHLFPKVTIDVYKECEIIQTIHFDEKPCYYFGQLQKNEVVLAHPSVSRKHSVLFVNERSQICLLDLGSRGGTLLNEQLIEAHLPYVLKSLDELRFAKSSRRYVVSVELGSCLSYMQRKVRMLEKELGLLERINRGEASIEELKASLGVNLPERVSQLELQSRLMMWGKVKEIKIPLDKQSGNSSNVAFVRVGQAQKVVNQRVEMGGRRLKLTLVNELDIEKFYEELRQEQCIFLLSIQLDGERRKRNRRQ